MVGGLTGMLGEDLKHGEFSEGHLLHIQYSHAAFSENLSSCIKDAGSSKKNSG